MACDCSFSINIKVAVFVPPYNKQIRPLSSLKYSLFICGFVLIRNTSLAFHKVSQKRFFFKFSFLFLTSDANRWGEPTKKFQIHSARFQVPKTALRAPKSKNGLQKPRKTPLQNGVVDIWVMRFHFRASIKPILKKSLFSIVMEPFSNLKRPKSKNCRDFFCLCVSKSETFFGGPPHL